MTVAAACLGSRVRLRGAGTGVFECADGEIYLMAGGIASARFWESTVQWLIDDGFADAARLLEVDTQVKRIVAELTAKGFKSPYLRNYVVARINPVRFHKAKKGDTKPPMPIAEALTRMAAAAKKFIRSRQNTTKCHG